MNCAVCRELVGEDKKYVSFITGHRQVTICTACLMKGMTGGSGSIVTERGVIKKSVLIFSDANRAVCAIAEEEGWVVSDTHVVKKGEWIIKEHWGMAKKNYWFQRDGTWVKDMEPSIYECFRRSCQNIRDYFGMWLKEAEKRGLDGVG